MTMIVERLDVLGSHWEFQSHLNIDIQEKKCHLNEGADNLWMILISPQLESVKD